MPDTTEQPENSKQQMALQLKQSKLDRYYSIKRKLSYVEATVEALPYWKNFVTVSSFISSLLLIAFIFYIIFTKFSELPNTIPLIYSQSRNTWQLVEKEFLLTLPIVIGVVIIFLIRANNSTFKFDRRLAYMINIGIILFSFLGFIAFTQILILMFIY